MKDNDVNNSCLISGGAGFIGSSLTEALLNKEYTVAVVDNFSSGKKENLQTVLDHPRLTIVEADLKKESKELCKIVRECGLIFHFAANPEVRVGETEPEIHFEENIIATFNMLEAIRMANVPKIIVFASTSAVYGEATKIPTPEDYGPLIPISTYGASKLACEALITSYAYTFSHRALILRFANVIGKRSRHGVIVDFIRKIRENPRQLRILGDGKQEKSYIHIQDCTAAIAHLTQYFLSDDKRVDIFNIGNLDMITVQKIAEIVAREMNHSDVKFRLEGGVDGGRGWKGDVKTMQLSVEKLLETGWKPQYSSRKAVEIAAKELQ